mgnify:CR=1 FL=1
MPLLVVIPLAGAFLVPVFGLLDVEWACHTLGVVVMAASLLLASHLLGNTGVNVTWVGGYAGEIDPESLTGVAMVSDGLSRLMLLIINGIGLTAVLYSISYMQRYTQVELYYSPLLFMVAGMNAIVLSGDLFNIYVFLEVAAIASYALVGFGVQSEELEASFKYLVLSAIASGFILLGVAMVYKETGTLNLAQIAGVVREAGLSRTLWLALGFFMGGFGLKAAMVPFHAWLPDAHPSAPAPISAMLSGVLIKASGVYVLARLAFNVFAAQAATGALLMGMGAVSMLVGVLLAVQQWDFKRLLAYHSISQMGYVVLALGVGLSALAGGRQTIGHIAVFAGLFHMLNHAVFKSLLFLCSGSAVYATGYRDLKRTRGVGRQMPFTGFCTRIACLSISGVPPFNGFFSKLLITIVTVWAGHWVLGGITVIVSFLTLLSFNKVQDYMLEGEPAGEHSHISESPLPMLTAMGILAFMCFATGLLVPLYRETVLGPASEILVDGINYSSIIMGG